MDSSFLSQKGNVVLVTGGSRGIGRDVALVFADAGADIALSGRKMPDLETVAGEIRTLGVQALAVTAHSRKSDELNALVDRVMDKFGRIDVLVNNAASNPGMGPLIKTDDDLFDLILETNLRGYFILSKKVGAIMAAQKSGVIINISSAAGVSPAEGLGPYSISKAGINMLTKALALELGPCNVRVNAIAPRIVQTDFSKALWSNDKLMEHEYAQTPLKTVATSREIAQATLFLASSATNYMTGHVLVINGGAFL
jgi:dehydrogenase/reductase SDR family member 4